MHVFDLPPLLSHIYYLHFHRIDFLSLDQVSSLVPSAVSGRRGRLVVQDLFDPLVQFGIDLGQHVESLDVLVDLLGLGSSKLIHQ
jgi:hypothetical protein